MGIEPFQVDEDGVLADQVRRFRSTVNGEERELRVAVWYSGAQGIVRQTISRVIVRRLEPGKSRTSNVARPSWPRRPLKRAA